MGIARLSTVWTIVEPIFLALKDLVSVYSIISVRLSVTVLVLIDWIKGLADFAACVHALIGNVLARHQKHLQRLLGIYYET